MITEAQRQEYIARGYDVIFERNNRTFVVNSRGVASWDDEKKEKFCNATGLEIFFEEAGNPVFYDPEYFEIWDNHLHYTGTAESNIPQPINCHSMDCMFYKCASSQTLDLSHWDVSNVTTMQSMFYNCKSLQSLDISNWNVSNLTDMSFMFYECESLQSLDLSNWDVSNVANMSYMFKRCESLQSLDLSDYQIKN